MANRHYVGIFLDGSVGCRDGHLGGCGEDRKCEGQEGGKGSERLHDYSGIGQRGYDEIALKFDEQGNLIYNEQCTRWFRNVARVQEKGVN